jgi:hypothetical protein
MKPLPLSPKAILIIGFVLVLVGAVLPFLMVIHILESTFFLNFFAFGAQVVGLFMGIIGAAFYVRANRH